MITVMDIHRNASSATAKIEMRIIGRRDFRRGPERRPRSLRGGDHDDSVDQASTGATVPIMTGSTGSNTATGERYWPK